MYAKTLFRKCVLAVCIPASSFPVFSATAIGQDLVLEEIIVTARKRAESLQETPVAVTALSSEALREQGCTEY